MLIVLVKYTAAVALRLVYITASSRTSDITASIIALDLSQDCVSRATNPLD